MALPSLAIRLAELSIDVDRLFVPVDNVFDDRFVTYLAIGNAIHFQYSAFDLNHVIVDCMPATIACKRQLAIGVRGTGHRTCHEG